MTWVSSCGVSPLRLFLKGSKVGYLPLVLVGWNANDGIDSTMTALLPSFME